MADLNPLEPGDVSYPQYSVTTTMPLAEGVSFTKGVVYTVGTGGNLNVLALGTPVLLKGFFQATATFGPAVLANDDRMQVLGPRTRMILKAGAIDMAPGDVVYIDDTTTAGVYDEVQLTGGADAEIGRIFEIYTLNSDSTSKKVTEIGDLVIVETVGP